MKPCTLDLVRCRIIFYVLGFIKKRSLMIDIEHFSEKGWVVINFIDQTPVLKAREALQAHLNKLLGKNIPQRPFQLWKFKFKACFLNLLARHAIAAKDHGGHFSQDQPQCKSRHPDS